MAKMKRNEHAHKQELKHRKSLKDRKQALRKEIADYLVDFTIATHENLQDLLRGAFSQGHKGFINMKSKNLIDAFEETRKKLHDSHFNDANGRPVVRFYESNRYHSNNPYEVKGRYREHARDEFKERADVISTKLLEIALQLDEE